MIRVILLLDFAEEYHKKLLQGILRYSREHGPWVFCRMPVYYRETMGIDGILKFAKEWEANGIIGQLENNRELEKFKKAGIAVIAQDFQEKIKDVPCITSAYQETGRLGAEYFLKRGFKNFAFYGFRNIVWSRERAEGFEKRLKEEGHNVHYYESDEEDPTELWYYKPSLLSEWLTALPKPIALMTCDDNQGMHITEACRYVGINIPAEIAILGVDNDETICYLSDPPLSSINLDIEKAGYEAADLMASIIQRKDTDYNDITVVPTHIITRHSTDIFSTDDKIIVKALNYIHQHIDTDLNIDDIVKEVPLSRRSLEIRFNQVTGYPIYNYIMNHRIEKFTKILLETEKTVYEIALELGLNDSKNISRQFKKAKGMAPIEYRKAYAKK